MVAQAWSDQINGISVSCIVWLTVVQRWKQIEITQVLSIIRCLTGWDLNAQTEEIIFNIWLH